MKGNHSHGKGVVDGVGGNIKTLLYQKRTRKSKVHSIQSANDLSELPGQLSKSTKITDSKSSATVL